jgi:nitroimidazol reductase NimA-like FMN-containing flavoprotein (pyridoxamine 5'-phosphate oxidase superfamily)
MQIDSDGLESLDRVECLRLLGEATLGRVAVTADALPCILPVTFRLMGGQILFRTSPGTKLAAATRNAVVAFEVDEFDAAAHTGWSVLVTGVASEVTDPDELEAARGLQLPRWAPSPGDRIVAVAIEFVSGRRVVPPAP